ncbi:hypothetical protein [uncultured Porphyromonas sp.]|jgi:hypothetical protein|uniref:hypothetical protein n=1 Tax=uncultured Porphyromonas sp. TaxID=159274 RepID=UPI002804D81F|nr:hypothetical protein [uncultured Porphyromonas sp.]
MDKRIRFGGINRTEGVWGGEGNGDFVDLVNMHPGERGHLRVVNRSVELAWGKDVGDVVGVHVVSSGEEHVVVRKGPELWWSEVPAGKYWDSGELGVLHLVDSPLCVVDGADVTMRSVGNLLTLQYRRGDALRNESYLWREGLGYSRVRLSDLRARISWQRVEVDPRRFGLGRETRLKTSHLEDVLVAYRPPEGPLGVLTRDVDGACPECWDVALRPEGLCSMMPKVKRAINEESGFVTDRYLMFAAVRLFDGSYVGVSELVEIYPDNGVGSFKITVSGKTKDKVTLDSGEIRAEVGMYAFEVSVGLAGWGSGMDFGGSEWDLVSSVDLYAYRYDPYRDPIVGRDTNDLGRIDPESSNVSKSCSVEGGRVGESIVESCDGFRLVKRFGRDVGFGGEVTTLSKGDGDGRGEVHALWGSMDRWAQEEPFDFGRVQGVDVVQGDGVTINGRSHLVGVREYSSIRSLLGLHWRGLDRRSVGSGGAYVVVDMGVAGRVCLGAHSMGRFNGQGLFVWTLNPLVEGCVVVSNHPGGGISEKSLMASDVQRLLYKRHGLLPFSYLDSRDTSGYGGKWKTGGGNSGGSSGGGRTGRGSYETGEGGTEQSERSEGAVSVRGSGGNVDLGELAKQLRGCGSWLDRKGVLRVSEADNGEAFTTRGVYSFQGDVVSVSTMQHDVAPDYRYGRYPLYVFTTDGVYAMSVGEANVVYGRKERVSGDVVVGGVGVVSTPIGMVLCTSRGVRVMSDGGSKELSDVLDSQSDVSTLPSAVEGLPSNVPGSWEVDLRSFSSRMREVRRVVYDYDRDAVVVLLTGEAYVYWLRGGVWSRLPCAGCGDIMTLSRRCVWVSQGDDGVRFLWRPLDLGAGLLTSVRAVTVPLVLGGGYSRVEGVKLSLCMPSALQREGAESYVQVHLLGSQDGVRWVGLRGVRRGLSGRVGNSRWNEGYRDVVLGMSRSRGWRYYALAFEGLVPSGFEVGDVVIRYEEAFDNRLR